MTSTTPPTTVSIRLPEGWWEIDPRAQDIVAELRRAIGTKQIEAIPEETLLRLLQPLALEIRRLCGDAELLLIGLYTSAVEVAGAEQPLVITAQVLLAMSNLDGGLDAVRQGVPKTSASRPSTVRLPAGEAVLETGPVTVSHPDWERPVPAHQRRYFLPVQGTARVAVLTFLTPNVDLAEPFDGVFEAIAETLSFSAK
jgi:hypothetical protein